ncbi:MAG: ParB/RepB/Spo0J family partition protein [Variovorax sp.]|nr:ParB/RepB/Spo0J family partition protein [Variovorax sp.]
MTEFAISDGHALADEQPAGDEFATLALSAIVPSLTNPRTHFDEAKLAELAESIKAQDVGQPILVRPLPANRLDETSRKLGRSQRATHEIISGERRYRASKLADKTTIPVLIRKWDDVQVLTFQLVENLQRDDLSELEEAEGYQRLIDQAAMAKEVIGERIGKSRSYVYQRLKLLELDPAGREALRKGEIDFSKALLIARVPDAKLQIKALGQATGSDNFGRALPVKDLQAWLQTNVMLSLKRTSFDIKDVTLREGAGACPECPKRTGANPDLFADVDSADLCTDPTCYHDKEKAAADRRFEAAQAEGKKVIEHAQAVKLSSGNIGFSSNWLKGYYDLDQHPHHQLDLDGKSLRKALGKHCPEPVLVQHPESGELHEVLPVDQVKKLILKHGLSRSAKHEAKKKEQASTERKVTPIEERHEYAGRWQRKVLERTDAHLKTQSVVPAELLRAWLYVRFDSYDEGAFGPALDLGEEFDSNAALDRILTMPDAEVFTLMLRFLLWDGAEGYRAWEEENERQQGPRTPLFELVHMAGVDVEATRAEIKREMESEDRAAEMEAQKASAATAPAAQAKGSARGKKSASKPAAPAKKPKTSESEARGEIAAALQAAEETDQAPDGAEQEEAAAPAAAPLAPMAAWPFPPSGASQVAPRPLPAHVFKLGELAQVRAGSKGPGGKLLKTIGRVGRVIGLGDDGRVHLKHGERKHELVVVDAAQLDPYSATPKPGDKVHIIGTATILVRLGADVNKYLWRHGTVEGPSDGGWLVKLPGKNGALADMVTFAPEDLEVLE